MMKSLLILALCLAVQTFADPEPQGSLFLEHTKPLSGHDRRPTTEFGYQHKLFEGKDGHFSASAGGIQTPGNRFEPHFGVQGTWRFRRSADPEPQGSLFLEHTKPLSGHDRRPTTEFGYQHKLFEGKDGHFSASAGGIQTPGNRFEPHFGVQGTWRFRRSAEAEPCGAC